MEPKERSLLAHSANPLEAGWLSAGDLRDFAFANPVRFYTDTNPDFFEATAIEAEVRSLLGRR